MDVGELLSFQPDKGGKNKRKSSGHDEDEEETQRKKKPLPIQEEFSRELTEEERERILEMVENEPEGEALDASAVKKMLLAFEKKVTKNQEMRIKYPDNPEKFMESELDLNEEVQKLHVLATVPEMYHSIVDLNAVNTMLGLISHDNTDISIAVIDLLQEMTDVDTLNESKEGASALIDALLEGQVIALLVQNLERLDESIKEESDGVHNTLGIVENMTELQDNVSLAAGEQGLLSWILRRLKQKPPYDSNKLYASEILSILLQNTEENRQLLGELNGIDTLLQCLSLYKRYDPTTSDETEYMENLFNCLCSSLMFNPNKDLFLRGEGLQLMILMLREKKMSRRSSLKVLDYAMQGPEGSDNCGKFVEFLGLRCLFPLFMKPVKKTKKLGGSEEEYEEHTTSILASLFKNLTGNLRSRLVQKFVENDHIKVDRLMELHFKYYQRVQEVDAKIEEEKQELIDEGEEIDEDTEDMFYIRRLDAGLFTLQLIDCIMLESCCSGVPSIKQHVLALLNQHGGSMKDIKAVMREYAASVGDAKSKESREMEKNRLLSLIDRF
ncbi:beta-catenin-like protein 1 isoform X1 [Nematostella vectensis]|uniref:beta-catenin-like protein 1 isoform X1 n=2 Tax=Nematostella vectensis TaxID=45351 RepID=UPI002077381C|nr:beta-catenin-like protein 1 isoform X1 [Nematostella vectensis]